MPTVAVVRQLSAADRRRIDRFLAGVTGAQGRPGLECERLDDHLLLDFRHGPRPGFLAALATDHGDMIGYAQASSSAAGHVVDSIVSPASPRHMKAHLLGHLLDELPVDSGVTWWAHDDDRPLAEALGLEPGRRLLQMRADLPGPDPSPDLVTRPYVVGVDDEALLRVNNTAFAWHGEQGGWDLDLLRQRQREQWFDPRGLLVHESAGSMDGFCWTKVHPATAGHADIVGEIYVVAVDPDHRGTGLGRQLVLAGLAHLTAVGAPTCMLYVDAGNEPAIGLYSALGFRTVHAEQSFTRSHTGAHDDLDR